MSRLRQRPEKSDEREEWRRLTRAGLFFLCCVALVVGAAAIGIYH